MGRPAGHCQWPIWALTPVQLGRLKPGSRHQPTSALGFNTARSVRRGMAGPPGGGVVVKGEDGKRWGPLCVFRRIVPSFNPRALTFLSSLVPLMNILIWLRP